MRYTRIDIEGVQGRYASVTRRRGSGRIRVEVIAPEAQSGRGFEIDAGDAEAIASAARCLRRDLRDEREEFASRYADAIRLLCD